jgi:AcrR family transcriptional regulator
MHPKYPPGRRPPPARQLLISAAARVFARDGLDGATTRAISREAGVNEVTLFRNFGTKEHLIEAVVAGAFGRERAPSDAGERGTCLRADLASFARRYEELLEANLPLVRTMIGEIHRHADCRQEALKGIFWPMREALVERLRAACKTGEARPGLNPALAADLLAGMVFSGVLRSAKPVKARDYTAAAYRDACVDVVLNGISAG